VPSWLSTCLWTAKKEQTNSMSHMVMISENGAAFPEQHRSAVQHTIPLVASAL
jgi:hypothetical protein